jgi:hypothetical protein
MPRKASLPALQDLQAKWGLHKLLCCKWKCPLNAGHSMETQHKCVKRLALGPAAKGIGFLSFPANAFEILECFVINLM